MMFVQHVISYFQKIMKNVKFKISEELWNSEFANHWTFMGHESWHKMLGFIHALEQSFCSWHGHIKPKDFVLVSYLKISIWLPVTVSPIHIKMCSEKLSFFLFRILVSLFPAFENKKSYSCGNAVLDHLRDLDYLKILFGLKNSGYYKKEDEV